MNIFKKDTEKHTNKLPMTGKVRKGFRIYCTAIMGAALILGTSVTAFAAGDPITVVNNLSSFIFGLIRAIGLILLGFGVVQVGLSLKSHDPSQRANGFLTLAGGVKKRSRPLHWDESVKHFVVPPKFGLAALFAPVTGSAPWMFPSPLTRCLHLCLAAVRFQPAAHLSAGGVVRVTPADSTRLSFILCDFPPVVKALYAVKGLLLGFTMSRQSR